MQPCNTSDCPSVRGPVERPPCSLVAPIFRPDLVARAHEFSELEATLFLVHGRDEQIIPFTESIALDAAAPDRQAELYVVASLAHVDLAPLSVMDFLALWRAAYRMLSVRDSMPAPQCGETALPCM